MSKKYDIVVWGATGFAGQLVAEYLSETYLSRKSTAGQETPGLRVAIAGRNASKLNEMKAALAVQFPESEVKSIDILVGNAEDQSSVDDVVSQARVVIACAGPFSRCGEPVVSACVRHSTHYVDITGEVTWVKRMIAKYHEQAQEKGVYIVPCCGMDSIPSDLGALMVSDHIRKTEKCDAVDVDAYFHIQGLAPSGGTVASIFQVVDEMWATKTFSVEPFLITPETKRPATLRSHDRDTRSVARAPDGLEGSTSAWAFPFLMAGVNSRVVRRSNGLLDYGKNFSYREQQVTRSLFGALLGTFTIMVVGVIAFSHRLRNFLLWAGAMPKPGEGPSLEKRRRARTDVRYVGVSESGKKYYGKLSCGDAGYTDTAKFVTECALCILKPNGAAKAALKGGVLTPASAFGINAVKRIGSVPGITLRMD